MDQASIPTPFENGHRFIGVDNFVSHIKAEVNIGPRREQQCPYRMAPANDSALFDKHKALQPVWVNYPGF
jgi:hypothetical protein